MSSVRTIKRARIKVQTGEVYLVKNARLVAGGWAFTPDTSIAALRHDRFQSSRRFIPLKDVVAVYEVPSRRLVGVS